MMRPLRKWNTVCRDLWQSVSWRGLPQARLDAEICLGDHGGCRLFIHDINDDGRLEFLWLQSAGIFKSDLFALNPKFRERNDPGFRQTLFCLTATDYSGRVLWQHGTPYDAVWPSYVSHVCDEMVSVGDVDADGKIEVLALDGCNGLLVLDGATGQRKGKVELPSDNFSVVKGSWRDGSAAGNRILVGNSDIGYEPHDYGNPWLMYDGTLKEVCRMDCLGGGHSAEVFDADGDGNDEFLIGYQLLDRDGDVIWTVDAWHGQSLTNPVEQHVDAVSLWHDGPDWFAAIAGSDRLYCIDSHGHCLWSRELPHPQAVVTADTDAGQRLIVFNQRKGMQCFDAGGRIIWDKLLPENWPFNRPPSGFQPRPIHMLHPATRLRGASVVGADLVLYNEGGWPYAVNDDGRPAVVFPHTSLACGGDRRLTLRRINDHGLAFESAAADVDGDGREEVIIYNRRYAWIYKLPHEIDETQPPRGLSAVHT